MRLQHAWRIAVLAIVFSPLIAMADEDPEEMGMQTTGGVTVTVRGDAWHGMPHHLTKVIPVLVTIENRGTVPIHVRYDQFMLTGENEDRSAAIPPNEIRGHETEVSPYSYPWTGYYGSPYWPGYRAYGYGGPYFYDPWFYPGYAPVYVRIELPTEDMLQRALPDRTVEPGDRVTGFLYFDKIHTHHDRAMFAADLVNPVTNETVGAISIPFEVD